jgi:tetratricopeptide (TPR) repeat protein
MQGRMKTAFAMVGALVGYTSAGFAAPDTRSLEVRVWTADEHELPALEHDVVREMQLNPRSAMAHHLLAHVLVRIFAKDPGDLYILKQASDLAQQAIDLAPKDGIGYVALADILDLMGNSDRGLKLLDDAETQGIEPNWRFYFTRARLQSDDAGTDKVLGLLETALAFTDAERKIIVPYVVALIQSEASGEDLIAKLDSWNKRFPSPLFDLTTAITYADLGKYQKAHDLYAKIIKTDPTNKEAKVNDAIILYRDLKDGARATALLEEVLRDHPEDLSKSVRAMITAHLGAAYFQRKMYDLAEQNFVKAYQVEQGNLSVLDFMTKVMKEAKAHDRLVSLLRKINEGGPGTGVTYALLGETLSEHLKKHDDALAAFGDAIILDPERSDYYNGMGLAYYRQKRYERALKLFVAATEVDPNDATARYNEACVLALMNRKEDAINTLAEALTLDPRLTQTAEKDADFDGIRDSHKFRDLVSGSGPTALDDSKIAH